MTSASGKKRTDTASRVIPASPRTIYQAFVNPEQLIAWLPPKGMKGQIFHFDPRNGGTYQMSLTYIGTEHSTAGKTSEHADVVRGRFPELIPDKKIVQAVEFDSDDPVFAGTMTMTWSLTEVPEGTEVAIVCEDVPEGIRKEDHDIGLRSTLDNLAAFVEEMSEWK